MHLKRLLVCVAVALVAGSAVPGSAQDDQIFDRFSIAVEASWVNLDTNLRLDSKTLGIGTKLDFESDGGLASSKTVPSLSFDWQIARRHRLGGWWQDVDRSNTTQILKEIRFGDQVFPVNEVVTFGLGEEEIGLGYTYFLTRRERFAFGLGGGVRTLRVSASLAARNLELTSKGEFTGPLPFVWAEVRSAVGSRWRFVGNLGLFYISIGDFTGRQLVLNASIEHLTLDWLSFGAGLRVGHVNVDVETSSYRGEAKIEVGGARVFARARF